MDLKKVLLENRNMSRYTKYPQGIDQKLPIPPSMKNDIVLTPNHEALHANSMKQPFSLTVDSRDRNMELYPNPNSYVIQTPRYKDVLSVELIAADIPHSGFNVDSSCNVIHMIFTQQQFINYYNGIRQNGVSYIEAVIPPGNYEATDFASTNIESVSNETIISDKFVPYQNYYDSQGAQPYISNTGSLPEAMWFACQKYGKSLPDDDPDKQAYLNADFVCIFDIKATKFVILSNVKFAVATREKDRNVANQPIPNFFLNQTSAQTGDSFLGINNNRFSALKTDAYEVLGFKMQNYFPTINSLYTYQDIPYKAYESLANFKRGLIDGRFDKTDSDYVQISKGENYYYPTPYPVSQGSGGQYTNTYNPMEPCDVSQTGLDQNVTVLATWTDATSTVSGYYTYSDNTDKPYFCCYSLPNRPNFNGEKYIILDIPELNYRDLTSVKNNQFYCRILFDTAINMVTLASYFNNINSINAAPSNLATNNTVKSIKGSDIGNNRCIKYFTPTQGVLAKLTVRWLKYDGTPYDFQGQDHAIHLEILTVKQTGTYFS